MKYITYVSGSVDLHGVPKPNIEQIKKHLEEIYPMSEVGEIFSDTSLDFDEEWEGFERSEVFLVTMWKIAKLLHKDTSSIIMCSGEKDDDFWGIIIKDNRLFTQRYELKAEGSPQEYEKVRF
ncbi:MAG: hypothetical protein U0457_16285 [Candidatus Sericytochromatia bacterium]